MALQVRPDDLLGNVLRMGAWLTDRELGKIGKPVDRAEWFMTPQTVNAYYNGEKNQMVFPAGILQPPFYSASASLPVNLGSMGFVVGHELTHGFDDAGSQFDAATPFENQLWGTQAAINAYDMVLFACQGD